MVSRIGASSTATESNEHYLMIVLFFVFVFVFFFCFFYSSSCYSNTVNKPSIVRQNPTQSLPRSVGWATPSIYLSLEIDRRWCWRRWALVFSCEDGEKEIGRSIVFQIMSSSSGLGQNPLNTQMEYIETVPRMNPNITEEQRSANEMNRIINQLGQLQVNRDTQSVSQGVATSRPNVPLTEEEELKEQLKRIIHAFVTRPNRRYAYSTTMRWTIGSDPQTNYNVVVIINHPFK
jgi:hypothetical protein